MTVFLLRALKGAVEDAPTRNHTMPAVGLDGAVAENAQSLIAVPVLTQMVFSLGLAGAVVPPTTLKFSAALPPAFVIPTISRYLMQSITGIVTVAPGFSAA